MNWRKIGKKLLKAFLWTVVLCIGVWMMQLIRKTGNNQSLRFLVMVGITMLLGYIYRWKL